MVWTAIKIGELAEKTGPQDTPNRMCPEICLLRSDTSIFLHLTSFPVNLKGK